MTTNTQRNIIRKTTLIFTVNISPFFGLFRAKNTLSFSRFPFMFSYPSMQTLITNIFTFPTRMFFVAKKLAFTRGRTKYGSLLSVSMDFKLFFAKPTDFNDTLFKRFIDFTLIFLLGLITTFKRAKMTVVHFARRIYINNFATMKAGNIFTSFNHGSIL